MTANQISGAPAGGRDRRVLGLIAALGLIGVASLALAPLEQALPKGLELPRVALLIQPAVLTVLFAWLGWWTQPATGLRGPVLEAIVTGGEWLTPLRALLIPAIVVGATTTGILLAYVELTRSAFAGVAQPEIPLTSRLLYGGMTEEIIARWGILTGLMALLLRFGLVRQAAFWLANLVAALLFALGHFGLLFSLVPHPPVWLVTAVLAGNMLPALGFGWLYRARGIECAMAAHALGHLGFYISLAT